MKITLVCHDIPYPPNHGARVDMWRRIKAFSCLGAKLQLICWFNDPPKDEEVAEIKKYVRQVYFIPLKHTLISLLFRMTDLPFYPLEVTSRILRGKNFSTLLSDVCAFTPDVVFLDGIHGGEVAAKLSKHLNVPMVTRSHNIEHLYYRRLLTSATGLSKLKRYLSLTNLESYEKYLLKNSAFFFDISADDLKFWKTQGFTNGRYLPPIVEFPEGKRLEKSCDELSTMPVYDILFLGNLCTNNNVAGIIWFITQVMPIIRSAFPTVTVLIAGSNPVKKVRQLCEEQEGIHLSINPVSSMEVYKSGRVLINPVSTGSGVSIKSLEMLVSGRPIVSKPQGIAGLPEDIKQYFKIAADAPSFGAAIIKLLSNYQTINVEQKLLESLFGFKKIEGVMSEMKSLATKDDEVYENSRGN